MPQSTPRCAQLLGALTLSCRLRAKDRNDVIVEAGITQAPTVYLAAKVGSNDEAHFMRTQLESEERARRYEREELLVIDDLQSL